MMHLDAHPDLMVTPEMPAATCFCPYDLYETLDTAEGGIAEWILPLVYQGHLKKLWWLRPPWARQFVDGNYRFCVGQVKATGRLRVSSTAPYFVDDRLHCPEADMRDCKPLHLCVSLAPEAAPLATAGEAELVLHSEQSRDERKGAPVILATENEAGARTLPGDSAEAGMVGGFASAATDEAPPVEHPARSKIDSRPTPWVLDICLDYFTTENPFMAELESRIGKEDAALVRAFYERPRFRGAATALAHDTQIEHERIFKSEVDRLLRLPSRETKAGRAAVAANTREAVVGRAMSAIYGSGVESATSSDKNEAGSTTPAGATEPPSGEKEEQEQEERMRGNIRGLQRLSELFDPSGDDRLLASKFASMVGRMGPEEREMVAWTDHCACLPRYPATREEIRASVRKAERLLRSLMSATGTGDWIGRPGVVTVARSEGDGYVPSDIVPFVEREVLAMLTRLFGDDGDERVDAVVGGFEVYYEEGLKSAQESMV